MEKEEIVKVKKKVRDANFELLRIVAMFMIIIHHYLIFGGILQNVVEGTMEYYIVNAIEFACIVCVNVYVMISGYYMIKSKTKFKKILQLELQLLAYSIFMYLWVVYKGEKEFNIYHLIKNFFPFISNRYWFVTAYMGLYLLIPFINKLAEVLDKKQFIRGVVILGLLLCVFKTIYPGNDVLEGRNGYSLFWFVFLYAFAGCIRLYYDKNFKKIWCFLLYVAMIAIQVYIKVILKKDSKFNIVQSYIGFGLSYNNLFIFIESVAIFFFFKSLNIKVRVLNIVINYIAGLILGVYLYHQNDDYAWKMWERINPYQYIASDKLYLMMILTVCKIFVTGLIIEQFRVWIFKLFGLLKKIKFIESCNKKFEKAFLKIGEKV